MNDEKLQKLAKETTSLRSPKRNEYTEYWVYNQGAVVFNGIGIESFREFLRENNLSSYEVCTQTKLLENDFRKARSDYAEKRKELSEKIIKRLFEVEGAKDTPFNRELYQIAYEDCHSEGYDSVFNEFSILLERLEKHLSLAQKGEQQTGNLDYTT